MGSLLLHGFGAPVNTTTALRKPIGFPGEVECRPIGFAPRTRRSSLDDMTASRTAARTVPGEATRVRLLDAVAELIYREGVGTGIQALAKAAGVSKRSMYELFANKDEVIAA